MRLHVVEYNQQHNSVIPGTRFEDVNKPGAIFSTYGDFQHYFAREILQDFMAKPEFLNLQGKQLELVEVYLGPPRIELWGNVPQTVLKFVMKHEGRMWLVHLQNQ
eukprot:GILJ01000126.1.p2 GENE.GILJ01000126.1~~GILJ01000126.1.p2  ORF type:complete len:105 (-),score=9.31 GILJ01000126.1:304-618(-)